MTSSRSRSGARTTPSMDRGTSEERHTSGAGTPLATGQRFHGATSARSRPAPADSGPPAPPRSVDRTHPVDHPAYAAPVPATRQSLTSRDAVERGTRRDLSEEFGGATLLVSDIRLAFMVLNEARYRTFELVGVPRDQANLATFVALVMAAERMEAAQRQLGTAPTPSRADVMLGLGTCNEVLRAVGGAPMGQHPLVGPLMTFALLAAISRPAVNRSMAGIRTAAHRLRVSFAHRYGHRGAAAPR